jgi:hypothetical protein
MIGWTGRPGLNAPGLNESNAFLFVFVPSGKMATWGKFKFFALFVIAPATFFFESAFSRSTKIGFATESNWPIIGIERFSEADIGEGKWVHFAWYNRQNPSTKAEWGARTRMRASFGSAAFPFIVMRSPAMRSCNRPRQHAVVATLRFQPFGSSSWEMYREARCAHNAVKGRVNIRSNNRMRNIVTEHTAVWITFAAGSLTVCPNGGVNSEHFCVTPPTPTILELGFGLDDSSLADESLIVSDMLLNRHYSLPISN